MPAPHEIAPQVTTPIGNHYYVHASNAATGSVGITIENIITATVFATFAEVRASAVYATGVKQISVLGRTQKADGGQGFFIADTIDTTAADDDMDILVDSAGTRWKRQVEQPTKQTDSSLLDRVKSFGMNASKDPIFYRKDLYTSYIYQHKGGLWWAEYQLSNGGGTGAYNLNQMKLQPYLSYLTPWEAGWTYTGTWSDTVSGNPSSYLGGKARQATALAAKVDIVATCDGDLYVVYTGRTAGARVKVLLDGATTYLCLPDAGGNKYFETVSSVDFTYKERVLIATGVPAGSHTITLEAISGGAGTTTNINALAWSGAASTPLDANTSTPQWAASTPLLQHQQVQFNGNHYYVSVAGTTGASGPTHTSGAVANGTATLSYMPYSGYALQGNYLQRTGSQLEYAFSFLPTGATVAEDVGGLIHGNETLVAAEYYREGELLTEFPLNVYVKAKQFTVYQNLTVTHSQTGATIHDNIKLYHVFSADKLTIRHQHNWQTSATFEEFCYTSMWPVVHWDAQLGKYGITKMITGTSTHSHSSYYGVNTIIGRRRDLVMAAYGEIGQPNGTPPNPIAAPFRASVAVALVPTSGSVNHFRENTGSMFAGKAMNISAATAPGYNSVVGKMYFERKPTGVTAGDVWDCSADYIIRVGAKGETL